jgi:hypothetical protein
MPKVAAHDPASEINLYTEPAQRRNRICKVLYQAICTPMVRDCEGSQVWRQA